jgi:hypothetical protein
MSTGLHMVSPASRGLFQRAILESNPVALRYKDLNQASTSAPPNGAQKLVVCF